MRQSRCALVRESERGRIEGFGLLRSGSQALYLGPVVATSAAAGVELIQGLIDRSEGQAILWDIPDQNATAVFCAEQHGFTCQRSLTRMFLGQNLAPGNPQQQFALTGPETG